MLKAEIKKEIIITNKEIAQYLYEDEAFLEEMKEMLEDMLYLKYNMDLTARHDAVNELTGADYAQIFESLANKMRIADMKG